MLPSDVAVTRDYTLGLIDKKSLQQSDKYKYKRRAQTNYTMSSVKRFKKRMRNFDSSLLWLSSSYLTI